jgi:hypothetical protein
MLAIRLDIQKFLIRQTIHYSSCHLPLYVIRYTLYAIRCMLYAVRYTLYAVRYTPYAIRCTLYAVRYTLYAIHYTLYAIRYIPLKASKSKHLFLYSFQLAITKISNWLGM